MHSILLPGLLRRPIAHIVFVCAVVVTGSSSAQAQTNFSFFLGATSVASTATPVASLGASIGFITKFNATDLLRIRSQVNVDRVQVDDVTIGAFQGRESLTMVCLGFGAEIAVGGRDADVYVNATPHGTIRTSFRTEDRADSSVQVSDLTRFSIGATLGAGFEVFITDNIGFELQMQYEIYNLDSDESDPVHRGFRGFAGLQFYLGRNFAR